MVDNASKEKLSERTTKIGDITHCTISTCIGVLCTCTFFGNTSPGTNSCHIGCRHS